MIISQTVLFSLQFGALHIMTSSNGNIFRLLALCEGNPPVIGGFPSQRPVTLSFDVFFDLHLNKQLRKQSRRRWFEAPSLSSWRHCNELPTGVILYSRTVATDVDGKDGWKMLNSNPGIRKGCTIATSNGSFCLKNGIPVIAETSKGYICLTNRPPTKMPSNVVPMLWRLSIFFYCL